MTGQTEPNLVSLDGDILCLDDAKVGILSPTFMYGLNVFESIRGYEAADNRTALFRVHDHIERLFQTCNIIDVSLPISHEEVLGRITTTLDRCNFDGDISIRMVVYFDGPGSWSTSEPGKLIVAPIRKGRAFEGSVKCCVSSWERISDRNMPPRAKVGANYVSGRLAQLEARRHGYDMPLLLNDRGTVSEAPGACFFGVRDDTLITPPSSASILESITRASILDIANDIGIRTEVREIDRTELYCVDEAFVCGTTVEVTQIERIDHHIVATGKNAKITPVIQSLFFDIARGKKGNRSNWLTYI